MRADRRDRGALIIFALKRQHHDDIVRAVGEVFLDLIMVVIKRSIVEAYFHPWLLHWRRRSQ